MIQRLQRAAIISGGLMAAAGCQQPLKVGSVAPDFSGMTNQGKVIRLGDLMGERGVVLYFYPKGETLGCVTQTCAFRDRLGGFSKRGYTVVGISCDSVDSPRAYTAERALPCTRITDADCSIARRYHVPLVHRTLVDAPSLLVDRQAFVIDRGGKIIEQYEVEDPEDDVRKAYEALEVPYH